MTEFVHSKQGTTDASIDFGYNASKFSLKTKQKDAQAKSMFAKNGQMTKLNHFEKGMPSLDTALKRNLAHTYVASRNSPKRIHGSPNDSRQAKKEIIASYFDRDDGVKKNKTMHDQRGHSPLKPMSFMTSRTMGNSQFDTKFTNPGMLTATSQVNRRYPEL